jgi:hypothetical protein
MLLNGSLQLRTLIFMICTGRFNLINLNFLHNVYLCVTYNSCKIHPCLPYIESTHGTCNGSTMCTLIGMEWIFIYNLINYVIQNSAQMICFYPLLYTWCIPTLPYLLHFPTVYLLPAFTIRMSRHCLGSLRAANFSPFYSHKFSVSYYTRIPPYRHWGPLNGYRLSFPGVKRPGGGGTALATHHI